MVVEDDREVADFLVDHLEDAGLTTFAFVTGEEAVVHAERMSQRGAALDLVLVDIGLPGIDGLEVVRRLRKDRPTLAAFLITGYSDPNAHRARRRSRRGRLRAEAVRRRTAFIGRVLAEAGRR
jgi:CheY-like chemotaxis protein